MVFKGKDSPVVLRRHPELVVAHREEDLVEPALQGKERAPHLNGGAFLWLPGVSDRGNEALASKFATRKRNLYQSRQQDQRQQQKLR